MVPCLKSFVCGLFLFFFLKIQDRASDAEIICWWSKCGSCKLRKSPGMCTYISLVLKSAEVLCGR